MQSTPKTDTEAFRLADTNPLRITTKDPVSTFSVVVDTAGYAIVRQSLMSGRLPPKGAVRIEEMVNYFLYTPSPAEAEFDVLTAGFETIQLCL